MTGDTTPGNGPAPRGPPPRHAVNAWGLSEAQRALLLDPERHLQALYAIAADALMRGALDTAYACADRLCRLSGSVQGQARALLVRAEVARRLGEPERASDDMARALSLDPTDILVCLHALQHGESDARLSSAQGLIDDPAAPSGAVQLALAVLQAAQARIIARIEAGTTRWHGVVAWPRGQSLTYIMSGPEGETSRIIDPDPAHPLASASVAVATVQGIRPGPGAFALRFACRGEPALETDVACPSLERAPKAQSAPESLPGGEFDLSVIVPVYEDEAATARCLDTLEAQNLPGLRWRIVVVNDASPNAALVADVARRAAEGRLTLIHLATNVGYAAAVNRAAGAIRSGALLLLNADTLLPEGALERLMAIASQTPDLGTLTPLSNDGVVTSFPLPYTRNDLPSPEDLAHWDAAAKAAGHGPVAIPNGIGFCLLVTRACWDAVGGLPLTYGRGYFEDVELCLTARTLGFRNLCAMNAMVGHVGSRSFGASKRRLVMKNSAIFAARFPEYQAEIDAFQLAQPFRPSFAAIECRLAPPPYDLLILNPLLSTMPALALQLAREEAAGRRVLLIEPDERATSVAMRLRGHGGGLPQTLSFVLNSEDERRAMRTYLRGTGARRVLIASPERCPPDLLALAAALDRPVDHLLAGPLPSEAVLRQAASLICADGMTLASARRALSARLRKKLKLTVPEIVEPPAGQSRRSPVLGILSPVARAETSRLVQAIETRLRRSGSAMRIVILGVTLNDLTHLADGASFVTGPVAVSDLASLVRLYGCTSLVLPMRDGLFECLEAACAGSAVPRAYFDRSGGAYEPRAGDLMLDPALNIGSAADALVGWLAADARIAA